MGANKLLALRVNLRFADRFCTLASKMPKPAKLVLNYTETTRQGHSPSWVLD
jgi:hypothetical protein